MNNTHYYYYYFETNANKLFNYQGVNLKLEITWESALILRYTVVLIIKINIFGLFISIL
jgi:hypothetical protein